MNTKVIKTGSKTIAINVDTLIAGGKLKAEQTLQEQLNVLDLTSEEKNLIIGSILTDVFPQKKAIKVIDVQETETSN